MKYLMHFDVHDGYKSSPIDSEIEKEMNLDLGGFVTPLNQTIRLNPGEYIRVIDHETNESDVKTFFKEIKKDLKECKKHCFKAYREYAKYEKNLNHLFNKKILEEQNK